MGSTWLNFRSKKKKPFNYSLNVTTQKKKGEKPEKDNRTTHSECLESTWPADHTSWNVVTGTYPLGKYVQNVVSVQDFFLSFCILDLRHVKNGGKKTHQEMPLLCFHPFRSTISESILVWWKCTVHDFDVDNFLQ